jgi:hypothetical protein
MTAPVVLQKKVLYTASERLDLGDKLAEDSLFDGTISEYLKDIVTLSPNGRVMYGFLTNTLEPPQLLAAMVGLYGQAPWDVRLGLMGLQGREASLLARLLLPG